MSDGRLTIEAVLDSEQFKLGVQGIIAESQKTAERSSSALSKIGTGFKNVAKYTAIGVGAFGAVTAAVGKLVNEYEEGEIAERRLAAVMKSMGTYTAQAHAEFIAFAKEMHATTNFTDDQVNKTVATLSTFSNLSKDVIKQAAKVSLDMGELLGGDAAIQIGKALQDKELAVGLRRVGVNIDMNKVKVMNMAEYQQYVLKELNTEFGGIAEASINPVKMLRKTMEDIMADMGKALLPLFKILTPIVKGLMTVFSSVTSFLSDLIFGSTDVLTAMKELRVANEQYKKSVEETTETDKLIAKYEELSNKANKSVAEQEELIKVTQKLANVMPQTVTAINAQGEAIQINTDRARELNGILKKVAEMEFEAKIAETSSQLKKAFDNFQKYNKIMSRQQEDTSYGMQEYNANQYNADERFRYLNTESGRKEAAEYRAEAARAAKALDDYEGRLLSFSQASDKYINDLAKMRIANGQTALSVEQFRDSFRQMQDIFGKFSEKMKNWAKLTAAQQQAVLKSYSEEGQRTGNWTQAWANAEKTVQKLASQVRQHTFSQSAGKIEDIIGKLAKLREEMEWLQNKEIEIKIKDNFKKVLDQFEKLTSEDRTLILRSYVQGGQEAGNRALQDVFKKRGYTTTDRNGNIINDNSSQQAIQLMSRVQIQNAQDIKKSLETTIQTYQDFINANNELAKSFNSVNNERKKQIENLEQWEANAKQKVLAELYKRQQDEQSKLIQWEVNEREKALMTLSGTELANRLKAIETESIERQKAIEASQTQQATQANRNISQEFANRRKMINQLSDIQKAEAVTNTIGTVTNQITALAQSKTVGQGITNAGNLAGNIPVVGGVLKGVTGIVGGLVDFFKKEGETFAEKWQRLFDLTQARYNFELAKENEIMASVQKRMEVYSRLEKLYYNNESKALEEQMKILRKNLAEIVDKFSQKGTLTLGGQTYDVSNLSEMTQEDQQALLEALTANESQFSNLAKTTVEYNVQQLKNQLAGVGHVPEGMSESQFMSILAKAPRGKAIIDSYNAWVKSLRDTGYTGGVYSLRDLADRHGNSGGQGVEDLNRNMQEFNAYFQNAQANAESMSGYLETYIDQTAELVSLEEAKTNELSEQLNIQNKLNDTLKARLRALNDSRINSLLDKLSDIEYQIATGQLTQSQGNIAMAQIESQIANQLQATGNTALSQQLLAARAELLKASNEKQYNALAGKGNIVEFHTGGFVTSDGIARLAAGEYVLRPDQYNTLSDFVRGFQSGVKPSETLIMDIMNHFNITVADDTDINKIENAVYTVFRNIENQTGRKILAK